MMGSSALLVWVLSVVGQASAAAPAPADSAWLKAVPTEADVVVRVRALGSIRDDMEKMLQAMSPNVAEMVQPILQGGLDQLTGTYGQDAAKTPFLAMIRLPKPDEAGAAGQLPPYAVVLKVANYKGVQQSLAGGEVKAKPQKGGYDELDGSDGQKYYSFRAPGGFTVIGTDEDLIAAAAKPKATLASALNPAVRDALLGGDVGVYANLKAVQAQYGEQIQQARQQLLDLIGQGGQADADAKEEAKSSISRLFDSFKNADTIAFHFDFDTKGLVMAGDLLPRPEAPGAARLGKAPGGTADRLGSLPADASYYAYLNVLPDAMRQLRSIGSDAVYGGKPTEAANQAAEMERAAGAQESVAAIYNPIRKLRLVQVADPKKLVESMAAELSALKPGDDPSNLIKSAKVDPKAETYRGFSLRKATVQFDLDKAAKLQPNNAGASSALKAMIGGDTMTTWFGTDGKQVLSVDAKDWAAAKAEIDTALTGQGGLGQVAAYKSVRAQLPPKANIVVIGHLQGMIRQAATAMAATPGNEGVKVPADMPKAPALFGGAISNTPHGFQFQGIVPSAVGPVIEKGLLPLLPAVGGQ